MTDNFKKANVAKGAFPFKNLPAQAAAEDAFSKIMVPKNITGPDKKSSNIMDLIIRLITRHLVLAIDSQFLILVAMSYLKKDMNAIPKRVKLVGIELVIKRREQRIKVWQWLIFMYELIAIVMLNIRILWIKMMFMRVLKIS